MNGRGAYYFAGMAQTRRKDMPRVTAKGSRSLPDSPTLARLAGGILKARLLILAVLLALSVVLGRQAARLRMEWNEHAEIPADDPEFIYFESFLQRFGGEEFLVVALQTDDVFAPEFLEYLGEVTGALSEAPNVIEAVSLANAPILRSSNGLLRIETFLADSPGPREASGPLRREALAYPLWAGTLVAADGKTACINVMLPSLYTDTAARLETVKAVDAILRQHPRPGVRISFTGMSPLIRDVLVTVAGDLRRFFWLTPLLVLVFLALAFHTRRGMLLPMIVIGASVAWTLGLMSAGGGALDFATVMLPTLVAVNALSYVIHFLSAYYERRAGQEDRREVLVRTWVHITPALFMAALTTAVGFGSQGLSELRSVRELGVFSGLGVLLAFLLCVTVVPALLSWLPLPAKAIHRRHSIRGLRRILLHIAAAVNRDRWKIPLAVGLLLVLAGFGIRRIKVESQLIRHLPDSAPSVQGLRVVDEHLAGFHVLELVLEGEPGAFHEPWALVEMEQLQRHVEGLPGVHKVLSINDLLREAHKARYPSEANRLGLPETAGQIAEHRLLFSVSGQDRLVHAFVTPDGRAARLSTRIAAMTTADHLRLFAEIEHVASQHLDSRLVLHTTGVLKLFATKVHALIRSLIKSFGLSFVLIAVLMMAQLRSVKAGLLSMIPNVLPILLGFGLMGFLNIPLSAGTVMIPAVGIGLAVDDTIHFLLRYRREKKAGRSAAAAIRRTMLGAGRAMVYASLVLAAGFSILLFSRFRLNREFGLLTAFIMLSALVADLLVTPYLTRVFRLMQEESS